jgi:hypothetical protein
MSPVPHITHTLEAGALVRRDGWLIGGLRPNITIFPWHPPAVSAIDPLDRVPPGRGPVPPAGVADASATASSRQAAVCTAVSGLAQRLADVGLGRDRHLLAEPRERVERVLVGPAWKRPRSRGRRGPMTTR